MAPSFAAIQTQVPHDTQTCPPAGTACTCEQAGRDPPERVLPLRRLAVLGVPLHKSSVASPLLRMLGCKQVSQGATEWLAPRHLP